jgi:hypothetical protein
MNAATAAAASGLKIRKLRIGQEPVELGVVIA